MRCLQSSCSKNLLRSSYDLHERFASELGLRVRGRGFKVVGYIVMIEDAPKEVAVWSLIGVDVEVGNQIPIQSETKP